MWNWVQNVFFSVSDIRSTKSVFHVNQMLTKHVAIRGTYMYEPNLKLFLESDAKPVMTD